MHQIQALCTEIYISVHNKSLPKSRNFLTTEFCCRKAENAFCSRLVPKVDSFWAELLPLGQQEIDRLELIQMVVAQRLTVKPAAGFLYSLL